MPPGRVRLLSALFLHRKGLQTRWEENMQCPNKRVEDILCAP